MPYPAPGIIFNAAHLLLYSQVHADATAHSPVALVPSMDPPVSDT
jgi:hypothetical protein